ncbi:MAG: serine/threonine protein kinase [Deltaproteobacteria bacterium]|nr:MAG: serine/threonine protein kinase [Deltaproteobacteria bacterium]
MNEKPTVPAPDGDATHRLVGEETRHEHGQSTVTVQPGEETALEDESLEDRIRRRLEATGDDTPKVDPLLGREIADRFQIYKKVGAGGMGAVYRARQKGMDRDVAIKVLLRELTENETVVRRFHIEALAVSKLRHPNTIQIFDFGETDDGLVYIAMEFLEGKPLQKVLKEEQQLSVRRSLNVALQMAKSLREAHSKGIVHRDLKPDNVVLETVGEEADFVKVLDFGVAKLAEGDGQQKTLTKAGSIFGTPKYMSPEQSRGGDIDARSDIYSIGVMLYELVSGRVPFNAENPLGILIKHIQELPPPFQEMRPDIVVPGEVEDFVMKLLEKDPAQRPQTAEAVIREIEKLMNELPDIFRRVVTREDAEAAGIEITTSSRTALDTDLGGLGTRTIGPFTDKTLLATPTTKRRKWPLFAAALLVVLLGGAGGIYASLGQLPGEYTGFTAIGDANVGTIPEFDVKSVFVQVISQPQGADVVDASGKVVGQTPYLLRRNANSAEESYTFKLEGFEDYKRSFSFENDDTVRFDLVGIEEPVVVKPPVTKPPVTKPPVVVGEKPPVTTDKPPVAIDKPPVVVVKPPKDDTPATFDPRKVDDTKANPFAKEKKKEESALPANPY